MYPDLFSIGSTTIHSYDVFWLLAIILGTWWTRERASSKYGLDDDKVRKIMIWSVLATFVGARLGYFLISLILNPKLALEQGILTGPVSSLTGMLALGFVAIMLLRRYKIPIWKMADAASAPVALTFAIGRIGCLLAGCCHGIAYNGFCAVQNANLGYTVIPVQAFYTIAELIWLVIILMLEKRIPKERNGAILWPCYMMLHGLGRFAIDFARVGRMYVGPLSTDQIMALGIAVAGYVWLKVTLLKSISPGQSGQN